jgi:nucleoside-diphosphate-sugar epimerase
MSDLSILVTGSCGIIGSGVSAFFARQGFRVIMIDSNHGAVSFGPEGEIQVGFWRVSP